MENPAQHVVSSKAQETWAFLLLTFVVFPLFAILTVASYGFIVWFFQLIAGPPSGH